MRYFHWLDEAARVVKNRGVENSFELCKNQLKKVKTYGSFRRGLISDSLYRKFFHMSGLILPFTYIWAGRNRALLLAGTFLFVILVFEILRLTRNPFRFEFIERLLKKDEKRRLSGSFYFVAGSLITIFFFPDREAVASLCVLSIADPLASLAGRALGRIRFHGKSLEGTLTFFACAFLILLVFSFRIPIAVAASLAATAAESCSSRLLDDNLWIPIVTAFTLAMLN